MAGQRPVAEMQFGDFVSIAFDQLVTCAAKMHYRIGWAVPMVVRCPNGGGVGGGPYHSENVEAWFHHHAGLKIVCPATAADAYGLLRAAIQDPNPVVFCEHKFLYRREKAEVATGADGRVGHDRRGPRRPARATISASSPTHPPCGSRCRWPTRLPPRARRPRWSTCAR